MNKTFFDENTSSQDLSSVIDQYINTPKESHPEDLSEKVSEAVSHPEISADDLSSLYHSNMKNLNIEIPGNHESSDSALTEKILQNPKTPKHIHEHHLSSSFVSPDENHDHSISHPEVSNEVIQNFLENRLKSVNSWNMPDAKNIHPDVGFNLFNKGRDIKDADAKHSEAFKDYALDILKNSSKHTDETLSRVVDAYTKGQPLDSTFLNKFISNNKGLTKDHINQIHSKYSSSKDFDPSSYDDVIDAIAQHSKSDPALLSLIANDKKYQNSSVLKNSSLPMEVFNNKVSKIPKRQAGNYDENDDIAEALLENPNITKDHVSDLVKKGYKSALNHEKADQSLIENDWNRSDKSAEVANRVLKTKNVSENILKELVNHKNQDVAIAALNHGNATESVVNEGLKRKAKAVQEEASRHPLVKDRAITERLKNKSVNASTIASDADYMEKFRNLSDSDKNTLINHFHETLSGSDVDEIAKKSKEKKSDVLSAKRFLARDKSIPQHIKDHHSDEIFDMFNKEFGTNSNISLGSDQSVHKNQVLQTVKELISDENPTAQKRFLQHVPLMSSIGEEVASKSKDPNFVKKLVKTAKESQGSKFFDRYGTPISYDPSEVQLGVLKNKNLELQDIKDYLSDPSFINFDKHSLDNILSKVKDSPEKKAETIDFLKNLNKKDVTKHLLLGNHLTGNDQESAFENLSSKYDKESFLFDHADSVSPNLVDRVLNGEFDDGRVNQKSSFLNGLKNPSKELQSKIFNHLDEASKSYGASGSLKDLLENFSPEFKKTELWKNNAKELSASNPHLASEMYSHHINRLPQQNQKNEISKLEAYENSLAQTPEEKDMRKKAFWKSQVENIIGLTDVFKKGELDHLADLQDSSEEDYVNNSLKKALLEKGLISDQKAEELGTKDPSLFPSYLSRLSTKKSAELFDKILTNPNSDKRLVNEALRRMRPEFLHYDKIDSENKIEISKKLADKISAIGKTQNQDSIKAAILGLTSSSDGHITKDISQFLMKKACDEILKNDKMPENEKVKILSAFSSAMDYRDVTHQATSKFLAKTITESGDINSLLPALKSSVFDKETKSSIAKKINDMLLDPSVIAKIDTDKLLEFTDNSNCTTEVKNAVLNKATEDLLQEHDPLKQTQKAESLASVLDKTSDENVNAEARIYHLAEHPNPHVRMIAYKKMRSKIDSYGLKDNIDLYKNMPDDADLNPISISEDEVNNSQFVEASTKGWKLDTLIVNGKKLNKENAKIMINRAIESEDLGHKKLAVQSLMSSVYADKNDLVKLIRSCNETDLINSLSLVQNSYTTNAHLVLSHLMDLVDQKMENPELVVHGGKFLDKEHTKSVLSSLSEIAKNIGKTVFDESAHDIASKNDTYEEILNKHTSHSNTILNSIKNEVSENPNESKLKANSLATNLKNIAANSSLKFGKDLHNKLMESYALHKDLKEKLDTRFEVPQILGGIIEKSEGLKTEDWKTLLEKTPECKFFVGNRSAIGTDISDHLSFSKEDEKYSFSPMAIQMALDKLDSQSLDKHGKRLFTEALSATAGNPSQKTLVETALNKLGDRLDSKDLIDIRKAIPKFNEDFDSIVIKSGAGGKEFLADSIKKIEELSKDEKQTTEELSSAICKSQHLDENLANKMLEIYDNDPEIMHKLAMNNSVHPNILAKIENKASKLSPRTSKTILNTIVSNSNAPLDIVKKYFDDNQKLYKPYFMSDTSFNPALNNSKWGPSLLREMPVSLPEDVANVDVNLLKQKTSEYSTEHTNKRKKALNVMSAIPDTGINWVEFKRQNPSLEAGLPKEIKEMFTKNANTIITKENMASLIRSMDSEQKKREYHLSYSSWDGSQTHKDSNNLVMTLNLSEQTENELKKDPKVFALYKKVTQIANGISGISIGMHPTTPYAVSWSRVDTDQDGEAWVIEELQADAVQKFRSNFRSILKNMASGSNIDGHSITSEEMKSMVKTIEKTFDGWERATLNAVIENAKAHGIKKLYMHGLGIRSVMSYGDQHGMYTGDYINPNIKRLYQQLPQEYGFSTCKYSDYPKKNMAEFKSKLEARGLSDDCWVLDLEDKTKA